jgi:hypothetical protein
MNMHTICKGGVFLAKAETAIPTEAQPWRLIVLYVTINDDDIYTTAE